jgi:BirA family transcriptional regulator, biotin operon repressor / biotin---[acetyl-CoA-carboxylase] ligase
MRFGKPHHHFRVTDSTNARARELVEAGAPGGTIVTAAEQTAGRGRQGRTWTAPPDKALLYSAILRPLDERHLLLPLSVPLAVCEAAEELEPGVECAVKWPNDVWIDGRKLAGVLIEAKPQDGWAVIGVGLNLSIAPDELPPELRDTAVSLFGSSKGDRGVPPAQRRLLFRPTAALGRPPAPQTKNPASRRDTPIPLTAAKVLSCHLTRWVDANREETLAAWRKRDALRGRQISWQEGEGVADGIEDSGDLVVVTAGGDRVVLGAGEVHLRL